MNENPFALSHQQDLALERRNQVLRNTYLLLGLSLIPTLLGAALGINSFADLIPSNRWIGLAIMLAVVWGLLFAIQSISNYGF
jgi:FtsH-binding integral membrane protein